MKILLTALNAKYIHTNLAIRYLKQTIKLPGVTVATAEYTINHQQEYIVSEIYQQQPELLCFSCYIWNIEMILDIAATIKKIMPETMILLGGPEVSYETRELMEGNDAIDLVIMGEGEITFPQLVERLATHGDYSDLPGLAYRAKGQVFINDVPLALPDLNELPFPYEGETFESDKILYYESSRGCPYQCQYCLSSTGGGLRFLPLDRVKAELKQLIQAGVRQVKFVDRTFNARKDVAKEIMAFIMAMDQGKTNFHFEVSGDLLDDEMLKLIKDAPVGLFQFEIGVQSTNPETLAMIRRRSDFDILKEKVMKVATFHNIHQHLDLIVGLPQEDYFSFRKSFDDVFAIRPQKLQIGFLKLLKGTGLREQAEALGLVYQEKAPYEILSTDVLSYGEIIKLKQVEEMVEIYWNSGLFSSTLHVLLHHHYPSPFRFFELLGTYWKDRGHHHRAHGKNQLYEILLDFITVQGHGPIDAYRELLKFDFLKGTRSPGLPSFLYREIQKDFKNQCHEFLQQRENLVRFLPAYVELPAKQIMKQVHFERFTWDVLALEGDPQQLQQGPREQVVLFDYQLQNKALDTCRYFAVSFEPKEREGGENGDTAGSILYQ